MVNVMGFGSLKSLRLADDGVLDPASVPRMDTSPSGLAVIQVK